MVIPSVESYLPELMRFVQSLVKGVETENLTTWSRLSKAVHRFFTPEMLEKVNAIVPGWREMAAYASGQTLVHIMTVFVALLMCPEYPQATPEQRTLMKWIVLFHDLAKQIHNGKRDAVHSFRSAALVGRLLPGFSFAVTADFDRHVSAWVSLTMTAITRSPDPDDAIQDNHQLPEIMQGIRLLFGEDSPAALIVKTVLLHQSISVVSEWPQAAPLTEAEIRRYIGVDLLPFLKMMMLLDNDAWNFFDPETKARHRAETLAVFRRLERLIHPMQQSSR